MNDFLIRCASACSIAVCRGAMFVAGAHWLIRGDLATAGVAVTALLLSFVPGWFLRDPPLRRATATVTALFLGAHIVFGMAAALYETSTTYDKWIHLAASMAIAGLIILASGRWSARSRIALPLALTVMLGLGGTVALGALWELFEFAVDLTGLFVAQRGLTDTMLDLAADTLGAALAVAAFAGHARWRCEPASGRAVALPSCREA